MSVTVEQIRSQYELEQRHPRPLQSAADLPISFEAITDDWLTAVLCTKTPGARVEKHNLSAPDNGSSNRRKIYISYNEAGRSAGLPGAVFCKATHDLANRVVLGVSGGALGEARFYSKARPLLNIEAPVSFFAYVDETSFNSMIMLGDISTTVQSFCDHTTQMTRARAESQVRLLARLHGKSYSDLELNSRIQEFVTFKNFFYRSLDFGFQSGCEKGFKDAEEVIPTRLFKREAEIWPATMQALDILDAAPNCLAHCDVHLKNWYIAGNGEMGLGDWQCCGRAGWARDLVYALTTALTPENRRAWERELIAYYLEELAASGGATVDFDAAFKMYRQQLLQALAYWTVTLSPPGDIPDMQPRDITLEFIRRLVVAMDDLDSLDAF